MQVSLPVFELENGILNIVDNTEIELSQDDVQKLVTGVIRLFDADGDLDELREIATQINLLDTPCVANARGTLFEQISLHLSLHCGTFQFQQKRDTLRANIRLGIYQINDMPCYEPDRIVFDGERISIPTTPQHKATSWIVV